MWKYLLKRFLLMIPTLLGVAIVTFILIRVIPGDVVELRYSGDRGAVSQEIIDKERARIGLDQPLWRQFTTWILGVVRLDFGTSMWTGAPIWEEVRLRFALSMQVAIMATIVAVLLAIPLGVLAALKQDTWIDYAVRIFSIAGLAMPSFWLGIVAILVMLIVFKWLPPMVYTPFWVNPWQNLAQLIWPALAVGYRYSAVATRMTRSAMLEVLREDYIRTARAKGLMQKLILSRHALKNAMLPVMTVIAHRVRVPHRRARGDRAGLQPQRARAAVRAGGGPPRLHAASRPSSCWSPGSSSSSTSSWTSCTRRSIRASGTADMAISPPLDRASRAAGGRGPPWLRDPGRGVLPGAAARRHRGRDHRLHAGARRAGAAAGALRSGGQLVQLDAVPAFDAALARHRRLRPRRALAPDLRLPHRAAGGLRRLHAGRHPGRRARRGQRLLRRPGRPLHRSG